MFLEKVKVKFNAKLFDLHVKKILDTPPASYNYRDDIKIVTLLNHSAVCMYLSAIKSFLYAFGSGSVYVLNDGSLTDYDEEVLIKHIPSINIENIKNINTDGFPSGGCWERLLYISDLTKSSYVIQIDSDTISHGPLIEVENAISNNRSFIIGNPKWPEAVSAEFMSNIAEKWTSEHVQVMAEKNFKNLDYFKIGIKYIRGCAAFTGFPKDSLNRENIKKFSQQMESEIGETKWGEWGSEQVASNVMLSSTLSPIILPWPRYKNYMFPQAYSNSEESAAFTHYIGSNRFLTRDYEKQIRVFINTI